MAHFLVLIFIQVRPFVINAWTWLWLIDSKIKLIGRLLVVQRINKNSGEWGSENDRKQKRLSAKNRANQNPGTAWLGCHHWSYTQPLDASSSGATGLNHGWAQALCPNPGPLGVWRRHIPFWPLSSTQQRILQTEMVLEWWVAKINQFLLYLL